jgi:hypothetical protein
MTSIAKAALVLAGTLFGGTLSAGVALAGDATPATPEPGVWQKHTYAFHFMGFTSTYSCDGLADELKVLLLAAGARKDVRSRAGACVTPYGRPDKFANANLTFFTLVPADAAKAAEGAPGTGTWRAVHWTIGRPRQLQNGDCEVIEQFRDKVLPLFTTRNVVDHTTCVPHQESGSVIDLAFESLGPAPG